MKNYLLRSPRFAEFVVGARLLRGMFSGGSFHEQPWCFCEMVKVHAWRAAGNPIAVAIALGTRLVQQGEP